MIVQGSNGVELVVNLWEKQAPFNLTGATVEVVIKTGARSVVKPANVVKNGTISVTLTSEDIATHGAYYIQARVNKPDGKVIISSLGSFAIEASIFPQS